MAGHNLMENTIDTRPTLELTGSTIAVTQAVVERLEAEFKGKVSALDKVSAVTRHKGRFNSPEEIKKEVTGSGCIRVTALNVSQVRREAGSIVGLVKFVAFVMTNDQFGKNRDQRAEVISGKLGVLLSQAEFTRSLGKIAFNKVSQVSWQNLYSAALDDLGVALWSVDWSQECRLDQPISLAQLDDFLQCNAQIGPDDGAHIRADIQLERG
ncbi:hypothetical protein [Moritella viscosa]|nr:hypothetical protein [Moritella viscosa]